MERLLALFPPPRAPTLRRIGIGESRILAVLNLPVYYVWVDVLLLLRSILPIIRRPPVVRILRTLEEGHQVFWIVMRSVTDASTVRGLLATREVVDGPELQVIFADPDVYSARSSSFHDAWSPAYGMELQHRPLVIPTPRDDIALLTLPDPASRPSTAPALIDDLPSNFLDVPAAPNSQTRGRRRPRKRKFRLDPADLNGALTRVPAL